MIFKCTYYLQTARYLSVARLMVRKVVHDIKIFFRGYLEVSQHYHHSRTSYLWNIYLPYIGKQPGVQYELNIKYFDKTIIPDTWNIIDIVKCLLQRFFIIFNFQHPIFLTRKVLIKLNSIFDLFYIKLWSFLLKI